MPKPQRDLTTGAIGGTLLAFALPTLGSNILQSLNGSINAIWVGRFLGEGALAATSNANIIMFLMFGAVFGFGMASTILVRMKVGDALVDAKGVSRLYRSSVRTMDLVWMILAAAFTLAVALMLSEPVGKPAGRVCPPL